VSVGADFDRVGLAAIGVLAIVAMLLIGFGLPSLAALPMLFVVLVSAVLLVRLL